MITYGEEMAATYANAALGFRRWDITARYDISSTGAGRTTWRPGINVAYCVRHQAPEARCECGLYAYHDLETLEASHDGRRETIIGAVAARGQMEVHHDGWRAEEVVVVALSVSPGSNPARAQHVAERYDVPLVQLDQLAAFAQAYAAPVPEQERPEAVAVAAVDSARIQNVRMVSLTMLMILSLLAAAIMVIGGSDELVLNPWLRWLVTPMVMCLGWLPVGYNWFRERRAQPISWRAARLVFIGWLIGFIVLFSGLMVAAVMNGNNAAARDTRHNQQVYQTFSRQVLSYHRQQHHWPERIGQIAAGKAVLAAFPGSSGRVVGRCYLLVRPNGGSVLTHTFCPDDQVSG